MQYQGRLKIGNTYRIEGTEIIGVLVTLYWLDSTRTWRACLQVGEHVHWTDSHHLLGD